ncbi:MAG: hypothetical protein ACFFD4_33665 [Candidatus Odinarchaeota archaeon]
MQFPTHLIAGATIQLIIETILPAAELAWIKLGSVVIFAFFSHFFIDAAAKPTYHPPEPLWDDRFWVNYHRFLFASGVIIAIILLPWFWLGMLAANAVDLWDWMFIRKVAKRKGIPDWGKRYRLHPLADFIRREFFSFLPDLGHDRRGAIPEIILITALFALLAYRLVTII